MDLDFGHGFLASPDRRQIVPAAGNVHHIELWVVDLGPAAKRWGWLLGALGYEPFHAGSRELSPSEWCKSGG